jgi:hypothetical protein
MTYSESQFVALGIQEAMRMRLTVICGLSGCTIFLSRKGYDFREKKISKRKMCVLVFSTTLL